MKYDRLYNLEKLEARNDKEFSRIMIELFLKEMPLELGRVEDGIIEKDYIIVKNVAHKIKPTIDYFCAKYLFDDVIEIVNWTESDSIMIKKTTEFIKNMKIVIKQLNGIK